MRLYLVRHGQTEWNALLKAQGHTDIPLDAQGQEQASRLGERLQAEPACPIWCSDLVRAAETARAVGRLWGVEPQQFPELRERAFGEWEGRSFVDIREEWSRHENPMAARPPGGESLYDVWERLQPVAERVRQADHDLLVVTHGAALSLLLVALLDAPPEHSREYRFGNCALTELERGANQKYRFVRLNDTDHLDTDPLGGGTDGARSQTA